VALIVGLVALVGLLEVGRGRLLAPPGVGAVTLTPGAVPIYLDGELAAGFTPQALVTLTPVAFTDAAEGKLQDGWLLRDVLLTYLPAARLQPTAQITVSSSSRAKAAVLTWAEVAAPENMVMFDLSNRGTLKLVSLLEQLDSRNEWVQDVDRIEVVSP
jgi:hypothetical protein